jgi:hypothetical protein
MFFTVVYRNVRQGLNMITRQLSTVGDALIKVGTRATETTDFEPFHRPRLL